MSHIMLPTGLFAVRSKMYVAAMHGDVESVEKHVTPHLYIKCFDHWQTLVCTTGSPHERGG